MNNEEFSLDALRDFSEKLDECGNVVDKFIESFKKEVAERVEYGLITEGERKSIDDSLDEMLKDSDSREKKVKKFINNLILLDKVMHKGNYNGSKEYKQLNCFLNNLGIKTKEELLSIMPNPEKFNETNFVELEDKKAANSKNQELYKSIEDKEKIVKRKLEFLKFLLIKLIQDFLKSRKVEEHEIRFALSLDKVILYPFFISTASDMESRKKMFRHVFTDFDDNKYGLFEVDVKGAFIEILKGEAENPFFPYFRLENLPGNEDDKINDSDFSNVFLFPPNFKIIEECDVEEEIGINNNLCFNKKDIKVAEIIPDFVRNILNTYPEFLTFDINFLQELSSYYKSWDVQKVWVDKTDFDALEDVNEDIRFEIFTSESEF